VIRWTARIALLVLGAAGLAWTVDRWLGGRHRGDGPGALPDPIRSSTEIDAPIEQVWFRLADIERQPDWMVDLKRVAIETPGPVRVGTRANSTVRILGIAVADPVEVTEFLPPRRYAIRHEGAFHGTGVFQLDALDNGRTGVTWDETLVPPILPNLVSAALAPILGRVFQADLERLAGQLEVESVAVIG